MSTEVPRDAQIPVIWQARTASQKAPILLGEQEFRPFLPLQTLIDTQVLTVFQGETVSYFRIDSISWGNGPNIVSLSAMAPEEVRDALFHKQTFHTMQPQEITE